MSGQSLRPEKTFDLVLVLVKAFDTEGVAKRLGGKLRPGTPVLTLQNGLGNAEALAARLQPEQVLAGFARSARYGNPPVRCA